MLAGGGGGDSPSFSDDEESLYLSALAVREAGHHADQASLSPPDIMYVHPGLGLNLAQEPKLEEAAELGDQETTSELLWNN